MTSQEWCTCIGQIMAVEDDRKVDHRYHQTLDNRRSQLRVCTNQQNCFNTRKHRNNTSGSKGVSVHTKTRRWTAHIRVDGKKKYLGMFNSKEEACFAYAEAARLHHGEFACL